MPHLDEQIDVRRSDTDDGAPTEFLWRGRLWQVTSVVSHWVESGPWWTSPGVRTVVGAEGSSHAAIEAVGATAAVAHQGGVATLDDPLREREIWRVEGRWPLSGGRQARPPLALGEPGVGVFDLVLSATTGCWRLTGRED